MATRIDSFREVVRFLLGDRDPTLPMYQNGALDAAVRATVRLRCVPDLALSADPCLLTTEATADQWALLALHTAKKFIAGEPDKYEFRSRALSEKFGGWRNALDELESSIHLLENGTMFRGWVMLDQWLAGHGGIGLRATAVQMTGDPPNRLEPYPVVS